jgi:hypothetical protein
MNIKRISIIVVLILSFASASAKDYPASLFGIRSDGVTLNTRSIQFAIDYIAKQGGGRLVFYVGRYLTGSIHMRSNVSIHLNEGAILVGSLNPFDYDKNGWTALIFARDVKNIAITGLGVIDGQGRQLAFNVVDVIQKGLVKDGFRFDRPEADARAVLIYFFNCENVTMKRVTIRNSASWVQIYEQSKNVELDSLHVDSKAYWNNDGIDIVDCEQVKITNCFVDSDDDGICIKSHTPGKQNKDIEIRNNTVRSSANGIKFGTATLGGFSNIRIINNRVYDTYRSAITLAAVDGGYVENILVDSLYATTTGNAIFLRIGERRAGFKGRMENVTISNLYCEVPLAKPDAGYEYEGPYEDMPRNISPAGIAGLADAKIKNITLSNITIKYPGGGNPQFAKLGTDQLSKVPEKINGYPEFSMFGELPAWGLYVRHAENITVNNLVLIADKKDYRPAIVLDDVQGASFKGLDVKEAGAKSKKPLFQHQSSNIVSK